MVKVGYYYKGPMYLYMVEEIITFKTVEPTVIARIVGQSSLWEVKMSEFMSNTYYHNP